jgi:hypothetical protein
MRPTLGLFHQHPHASAHCCIGMLLALSQDFNVRIMNIEDCSYRKMKTMQIVAFPGGVGEADAWSKIFADRADDVRRFVHDGGAYLGICMGAYWAGDRYFGLVPGTHIHQYIKAENTEIKRSYPTTAAVRWQGSLQHMFFWDGPVFSGEVGSVVATYANGSAMAIRRGRVGLIGCHPESQESWYTKKYLRSRWHGGAHGTLLKEFVGTLAA